MVNRAVPIASTVPIDAAAALRADLTVDAKASQDVEHLKEKGAGKCDPRQHSQLYLIHQRSVIAQIQEHDDKYDQDHDGPSVDQNLENGQELCLQQ